jgi:hypothetical protein
MLVKKEKLMVIRAVLLRIIERRREQQASEVVVADSLLIEDGLPLAKRTRRSSSSSFSCDNEEEFPTTGRLGSRHSLRLEGTDPVYNVRSLDDIERVVRRHKADDIMNVAQFEGYCPRHGNYNKDIVLRDHNHDTEILACYCHDDSSASTFDVVVSEVSDEHGISTDTLKYWVSFRCSPQYRKYTYY